MPGAALIGLIEPVYTKKSGVGRPPFALASMLRIHFLQQWFAWSLPPEHVARWAAPICDLFDSAQTK